MILLLVSGLAFGLLILTWVVYPLVMWLRSRHAPESSAALNVAHDRVWVVIATRDHPSAAITRIQNIYQTSYPASLLRVVVAVDRKSPFRVEEYREVLGDSADVVQGNAPGGKASNLNAGARLALDSGADVLVFADVGQEFNAAAIPQMVASLGDSRFGGVAGRYTQQRIDSVMAAYAGFEAVIRAGQARHHSVVSTSGSIYAIRAALWRSLPDGLICDDLFTTLSVVRQGFRVGFNADAVAYYPRTFTKDEQFARRVRTLTGLIQYITLERWVLRPWSNPIWIHFVMHKVLRLLTPVPLAIGGAALVAWLFIEAPRPSLIVAAALSVITIGFALVARRTFRRVVDQLAWLIRLQLVPGLAIANGLRGRWTVWTPTPQKNTGASAGVEV